MNIFVSIHPRSGNRLRRAAQPQLLRDADAFPGHLGYAVLPVCLCPTPSLRLWHAQTLPQWGRPRGILIWYPNNLKRLLSTRRSSSSNLSELLSLQWEKCYSKKKKTITASTDRFISLSDVTLALWDSCSGQWLCPIERKGHMVPIFLLLTLYL